MTEQLEGQVGWFGQDTWSGKTSPERSAVATQKEQTSRPSSKRSSKSASQTPVCQCVYQTEDGQNPGAITLRMVNGALLGEFTTRSFGERPSTLMDECSDLEHRNGVSVSRLSQILEVYPPQKYCLSEKACQGILNRAEKRGKELPPELKKALIAQARPSRSKGTDSDRPIAETDIAQKAEPALLSTQSNSTESRNTDRDQTAYGIGSYTSNAMLSDNPHAGIYEADTSRTLDLNGGSPACNQGGIAIVSSAVDCRNCTENEDTNGTLQAKSNGGFSYNCNTVVRQTACYGIDHVMLSGGTTYQGRGYYEDVSGCLKTQPHGVWNGATDDKEAEDKDDLH